jgi:hypothetical protein
MQHKADGGNVQGNQMDQPLLSQYRMDATNHANPDVMDDIGVEEAIDMHPKVFMNPNASKSGMPDVGGVATSGGLPIGGVDQNAQQPGQQLTAPPPTQGGLPTQQPQQGQQPQAGEPIAPAPQIMPGGAPTGATGGAPTGAPPNLLSMTPQGQKMQAMGSPLAPNAPAGMAEGGSIHHHSEDEMAFPERSFHAQEHNAHRIGIESIEDMPEHVIHKHYRSRIKEYPAYRPPVTADTMRIELMAKGKGK